MNGCVSEEGRDTDEIRPDTYHVSTSVTRTVGHQRQYLYQGTTLCRDWEVSECVNEWSSTVATPSSSQLEPASSLWTQDQVQPVPDTLELFRLTRHLFPVNGKVDICDGKTRTEYTHTLIPRCQFL